MNDQERFWAGEFGTDYSRRNSDAGSVASNVALFARALRGTGPIRNCIEFGANIGLNLQALRALYPDMEQHAVEINAAAGKELATRIPAQNVVQASILDYRSARAFDLVLVKGVLIHVAPDSLPAVYDVLHAAAGRYLLIAEYYNPTPVSVPYRGHADRLFKRDFAGEVLDTFPKLRLVDYGFAYHRDQFPQDDITWFLLEKR